MRAVKVQYWDASALVRLVSEDSAERPGRVELRDFFFGRGMHHSTSSCLAEALGVFKRKWLVDEAYTQSQYVNTVKEFYRLVVSAIAVEDVPVSVQVLTEAERLMNQYRLDFIDSIQIVTIREGRYSVLIGDSKSLFITADRRLARAAKAEGVRTWHVTKKRPDPAVLGA